jgi:DNA-binding SARP family transcriptional activator
MRCFGPLAVTVGGEPLDLSAVRPRARSTFRLLALYAGLPVHREYLVDALWPDRSLADSTRSVQVTISALRRLLRTSGAEAAGFAIVRDSDTYCLDVARDVDVDVVRFRAALDEADAQRRAGNDEQAVADLRSALDLYADDPLPEEGPNDWVVHERDRYRRRAADAAQLLAELHLEAGDGAAAVVAAERGLRRDRYRDALWHLLIAGHELAGERAAASQARKAYDGVLLELGVEPAESPLAATISTV